MLTNPCSYPQRRRGCSPLMASASSDLGGAESLSSLAELCQYYCSPSAYTLQVNTTTTEIT